jgi:hypothetical protein
LTSKEILHQSKKTGLPGFSWSKHTKTGRIRTKGPQTTPNGNTLYQMEINYTIIDIIHIPTFYNSKALSKISPN